VESSHRHKDRVHSIEVARNPKDSEPWILMTSSPSEIRTWSAKTLKPLKVGSICDEVITTVRILHPFGKLLVCSGRETSFDVLSLAKLTHHSTVEIPIDALKDRMDLVKPIECIASSKTGKYIACGGHESSLVHLIDGESLQHIRSFEVSVSDSSSVKQKKKKKKEGQEELDPGFVSMEFLPDGCTVCLVTKDGDLIGYNVEKPSIQFFLTDPLRVHMTTPNHLPFKSHFIMIV
jgi:WD40 repeat protein